MVKWLHRIMSIAIAWDSGQVPEDWQRAVIVPVHNKDKTYDRKYVRYLRNRGALRRGEVAWTSCLL